jgi:hypothetical protein
MRLVSFAEGEAEEIALSEVDSVDGNGSVEYHLGPHDLLTHKLLHGMVRRWKEGVSACVHLAQRKRFHARHGIDLVPPESAKSVLTKHSNEDAVNAQTYLALRPAGRTRCAVSRTCAGGIFRYSSRRRLGGLGCPYRACCWGGCQCDVGVTSQSAGAGEPVAHSSYADDLTRRQV